MKFIPMESALKKAKERVEKKKLFIKEVLGFLGTSMLLLFINLFTSPHYLWCLWAIVPMGITIFIKGLKFAAFRSSSEWEKKELRKELRAMGRNPDDYMDDHLELRDLDEEALDIQEREEDYRRSDLV